MPDLGAQGKAMEVRAECGLVHAWTGLRFIINQWVMLKIFGKPVSFLGFFICSFPCMQSGNRASHFIIICTLFSLALVFYLVYFFLGLGPTSTEIF